MEDLSSDRNDNPVSRRSVDTAAGDSEILVPCTNCHVRRMTYCHKGICSACAFQAKPSDKARGAKPMARFCPGCLEQLKPGCYGKCHICGGNTAPGPGANYTGDAAEPTDAMPGTNAKLLVMRKRAETGGIFHPADARDHDLAPGVPVFESLHFPTGLGDPVGDPGDEADPLADVSSVDALDHGARRVAELVGDLGRREAAFDAVTCVGVAQAVSRHPLQNAVVYAEPKRRPAQVMAPRIFSPRHSVAVEKHELVLGTSPDRSQQSHGQPTQANDARLASLPHRLVLDEVQVRLLRPVDPNILPNQIAHLRSSATRQVQEHQAELEGTAADFHQPLKLGVACRAPALGDQAAQGPWAGIRADRNQLFVACPTKAREDARYVSPLGVDAFPRRVFGEEFGQVMLATFGNWPVAELSDEGSQVAFVVFGNLGVDVLGTNTASDV